MTVLARLAPATGDAPSTQSSRCFVGQSPPHRPLHQPLNPKWLVVYKRTVYNEWNKAIKSGGLGSRGRQSMF